MRVDLSVLLEHLEPRLPERLVGPDARAELRRLTRSLPPLWEWITVETRLGQEQGPVDCLVFLSAEHGGRERMAEALDAGHTEAFGEATPLLRAWSDPEGPHAHLQHLWLEYDLPQRGRAPMIFELLDEHWLVRGQGSTPRAVQHARATAWVRLHRGAIDPRTDACIAHCLEALPAGASMSSVADGSIRGRDAVRLCTGLPPDQVMPWLQAIGWSGDPHACSAALRAMGRSWPMVGLQIEVDEGVRPYLSIEADPGARAHRMGPLMAVCDAWTELGWANPELSSLALQWPGEERMVEPTSGLPMRVHRYLHMKAVLDADVAPHTKAYFSARPVYALFGGVGLPVFGEKPGATMSTHG